MIEDLEEVTPISLLPRTAYEKTRGWERAGVLIVPLLLVCFSLFYFADVLLRASEKYFWYDELFTLYLCRLSLPSIWQALRAGADFNPPLIYILTKASQAVLGEGRIATRLPEIIAFWVFCLCLFRLVSRRAGAVAGLIAMLLPLFTGAFYYAYEARPHALVLACAGLSFVCWQMLKEGRRRGLWITLFGFFLFCAFMGHCYAVVIGVPFAVAELFETLRNRRLDFAIWGGMIVPLALAIPVYLPLLYSAHKEIDGTQFNARFPASWIQISEYFRFLFGPCLMILLAALLLLCLSRFAGPIRLAAVPLNEMLVAVGFVSLPIVGVLLGAVVGAPLFPRYLLSALLGFCFVLALAFGRARSGAWSWAGMLFAAVLSCCLLQSFYVLAYQRLNHRGEVLIEPSSGSNLETTPWNPLANESFLVSASQEPLPIAVRNPLQFLYIAHYSPAFGRRLYLVGSSENDFFQRGLRNWSKWGPRYNRPETFSQFVTTNRSFYLYGGQEVIWEVADLTSKGWRLRSLQTFDGNNLAWLEHPPKLQE